MPDREVGKGTGKLRIRGVRLRRFAKAIEPGVNLLIGVPGNIKCYGLVVIAHALIRPRNDVADRRPTEASNPCASPLAEQAGPARLSSSSGRTPWTGCHGGTEKGQACVK